jgi:hypothetical protein
MTKITVAIPMYEFNNKGREVLEHSFKILETQTFKDFDVVISDHSVNNEVENLCKEWSDKLDIKYFRNEDSRGCAAVNFDNMLKKSTGEWIKILLGDDYLRSNDSLQIINDNLDDNIFWLATAYVHTKDRIDCFKYHMPMMNPQIFVVNTIGTSSCLTIKNVKDMPLFDRNLDYCYDCDFYYRFQKMYGDPKTISDVTMVNYLWGNSVTSKTTPEMIQKEEQYILRKYGFINDLETLAHKYGTDKMLPIENYNYHGYTPFYNSLFNDKRESYENILEIGIFEGGSHRMWHDYFSNATIYGIDITLDYCKEEYVNSERIKLFVGKQEDKEFLDNSFKDVTFDLIVDDGSHFGKHQQLSFLYLWPRLKSGGYYIIEDLAATSYPEYRELEDINSSGLYWLQNLQQGNIIDYYISVDDTKNILKDIESIEFNGELGVIRKK